MSESPADLLRRAADKLDKLHRDALDAPWWMDGNDLMHMSTGLQPEPIKIGKLAEEDAGDTERTDTVLGEKVRLGHRAAMVDFELGDDKRRVLLGCVEGLTQILKDHRDYRP